MTCLNTSLSLAARLAQWRALGMLFVVFARQLLAMQRRGVRGTYAKADTLEQLVRIALAALWQEVAVATAAQEPLCEEDAAALRQMQVMATALFALAVFLNDLKQKLTCADAVVHNQHAARIHLPAMTQCLCAVKNSPIALPGGYYDTS